MLYIFFDSYAYYYISVLFVVSTSIRFLKVNIIFSDIIIYMVMLKLMKWIHTFVPPTWWNITLLLIDGKSKSNVIDAYLNVHVFITKHQQSAGDDLARPKGFATARKSDWHYNDNKDVWAP